MKQAALKSLPGIIAGFCLADFAVLFYGQWYFAGLHLLKTILFGLVLAAVLAVLIHGAWGALWRWLSLYWIAAYLLSAAGGKSFDLTRLGFTQVLDYEAAMVWLPLIVIFFYALSRSIAAGRAERGRLNAERRKLAVRAKMREIARRQAARAREAASSTALNTTLLVLGLVAAVCIAVPGAAQASKEPVDPARPWVLKPDRHDDFTNPAAERDPYKPPEWPAGVPIPMHERVAEIHYIYIENQVDGRIAFIPNRDMSGDWIDLGHVLSPVSKVNPKGYTASGWAAPGTVCATAVNAIHIKTDHDYENGRGVIFSVLPIEFADFDPVNYLSYYNASSSLFTDIHAGTSIFGGKYAPLTGAKLLKLDDEWSAQTALELPLTWAWYYHDTNIHPVAKGYVPQVGDKLLIEVKRRAYNPEYIEFENAYGGLIWVKEVGMDPYPIGQVLKPVAGVGRFLGTEYAGIGRIRAAHPGVIDVSTSPMGVIGGFQIIPRDHAMSPEMTFARTKTQWMVVGPLWALDKSLEGMPPLFSDYLYPDFTPAMNPDGSVNEDVSGAAAFLDRFTVRGRYSDEPDPDKYILLREYTMLNNAALENLTHVRIYFPRGNESP